MYAAVSQLVGIIRLFLLFSRLEKNVEAFYNDGFPLKQTVGIIPPIYGSNRDSVLQHFCTIRLNFVNLNDIFGIDY
jgi:hypothetical protein